jgi:hypothetical protein
MASTNDESDLYEFSDMATEDLDHIGHEANMHAESTTTNSSTTDSSSTSTKRVRGVSDVDLWAQARKPYDSETSHDKHGHRIFYCSRCSWKGTTLARVRSHLKGHNITVMPAQPSLKKVAIQGALQNSFARQSARQEGRSLDQEKHLLAALNKDVYNEALVKLITVRNLPHTIVEWPEFYSLIYSINYMALATLVQSRQTIPHLIEASFHLHQVAVKAIITAALTLIHFSIDVWSSPGQKSYLAVIAHFIDSNQIRRNALIALRLLHAGHTGEAMADIVQQVFKEYELGDRIGWFTLDNVPSNDVMLRALARIHTQIHPVKSRLRCNGHIINLSIQDFLFRKGRVAAAEAGRQIAAAEHEHQIEEFQAEHQREFATLSERERTGTIDHAIAANHWRTLGVLGKLHNLVIYILSSDIRVRAFREQAGRLIPRDNSTRWNSWFMMLDVALRLRGHINNFIDSEMDKLADRGASSLRLDYLSPNEWQELQDVHAFLQPFAEVTKKTEGHSPTLDEVLTSMDFLISHFKNAKRTYSQDPMMMERLINGWYKFDKYYKLTDKAPVYATAILLHPGLRERYLYRYWSHQSSFIKPAIDAARDLWLTFKPAAASQQVEVELTPYERWQQEVYLQEEGAEGDEFDRFIKVIAYTLLVYNC